ncbi:EthD family reductase [Pseudomonas sp. 5P_3.1_Bac2]|uniref:EthD family reductase n=1 Tax=Pseudomonas sp. 5P_3.1_Bac2 TaxID=2971617 RepID=UPI0021C9F3D5|nr:EthD family reductase [Pseudomonas sp. 5P_3.1_Bac2]MCU1717411.1 EthD family reductase [Pseudomonas sp. 5P_3.1_Bac2]
MIKVSVLYPYQPGVRLDLQYYCERHMAIVRECLGEALQGIAVESGLTGATPGSTPAYVTMGHLYFASVEAFQQAFAPHAERIMADLPNFTDSQPTIQISDIVLTP